jgi:hypothetical protein
MGILARKKKEKKECIVIVLYCLVWTDWLEKIWIASGLPGDTLGMYAERPSMFFLV